MKLEPQPTDELARLGALLDNRPIAMMTTTADDGALVRGAMEAPSGDTEPTTLR
ncbi:MAG: hypothetical protein M3Y55_17055 [Pseudomonadota bacterium]|nr:hypothetical protein [Pseudomonadota bacterium]